MGEGAAATPGERASVQVSALVCEETLDLVDGLLAQLWLRDRTITEADRSRFELAVIEIVSNIVEHAGRRRDGRHGYEAEHRLDVCLGASPERLVATFSDNGRPFEASLSAVSMPSVEAESGRGLALAIAVTDEFAYSRAEERNTWRLACVRSGADPVPGSSGR